MTVVTSEPRLIGTGTPLLPRVNLLPPEIAEKAAFQKIQIGLGAAVLATLGVVGVLYTSAASSVSSANSDLASANAQQSTLQAEAAKYRSVTAVYSAAAAAEAQLVTAMGDEVRYSQLMNDLALTVPSNVWLKNMTYTTTPPAAPVVGAAAATATDTGIGTFNVTGVAFSHDDVAVWLESLAGLGKTYANPYFSSSAEVLLGTRKVVNFMSTATVKTTARSGRYAKAGS